MPLLSHRQKSGFLTMQLICDLQVIIHNIGLSTKAYPIDYSLGETWNEKKTHFEGKKDSHAGLTNCKDWYESFCTETIKIK